MANQDESTKQLSTFSNDQFFTTTTVGVKSWAIAGPRMMEQIKSNPDEYVFFEQNGVMFIYVEMFEEESRTFKRQRYELCKKANMPIVETIHDLCQPIFYYSNQEEFGTIMKPYPKEDGNGIA